MVYVASHDFFSLMPVLYQFLCLTRFNPVQSVMLSIRLLAFLGGSLSFLPSTVPVASLGWVTPGASTEGVTPLFFPGKPGDLFLLIAVTVTIAFYCFHSGVTPSRVGCHLLYLSYLVVFPLFFVNLPTKIIFFLRVSPPSDATALCGVEQS